MLIGKINYYGVIGWGVGFEPLTLGFEMRGFVVTNCIELARFVILQGVYENGLKTRSPKLRNRTMTGQ